MWVYHCADCRAEIHVEQNLFRKLLASPPPIVSLFDALVARFDEERWKEYQRRRRWFEGHPGLREWFFSDYEDQLAREAALEAGRKARERDDREASEWARAQKETYRDKRREQERTEQAQSQRTEHADEQARTKSKAESQEEFRARPPSIEIERTPCPHEVLGVAEDVSLEELSAAYKERAKKYHPDRFAHLDTEFQDLAHKRFLEIKSAYDELKITSVAQPRTD
jgi:DnaJ-domain-containing protein 1